VAHGKPSSIKPTTSPSDLGCLLCGIVINEVEGLLAENMTQTEIIAFLQKDICSHIPSKVEGLCDTLVALIPDAITEIENGKSVGVVCVEKNYCVQPFTTLPDPMAVPTYVVNLDLAPEQRKGPPQSG